MTNQSTDSTKLNDAQRNTVIGLVRTNCGDKVADAVAALLATDSTKPETQSERVLAQLDALGDDAAVHIFPDDLEKCSRSECVVQVTSVRAGSPTHGKTVPLFSREQVAAALLSAGPARVEPLSESVLNSLREKHGITSTGRGIREWSQIVRFAREIEAAHGIGKDQA